jgi:serine/threonine protein phosphatase PrpC
LNLPPSSPDSRTPLQMDHLRRVAASRQLKWSGQTDRGKVRPNNEDSFLGLLFNAYEVHHLGKIGEAFIETTDFAFAVSDGMGGAMAGEFASRITMDKITRLMPRAYKQSAIGLETGFTDVLTELFDQIHRNLAEVGRSYHECAGMETTLSLCWFTLGWMYFGHIGDSRIYYLPAREGGIRQLSHDDTHVGWLLRNGELTEREALGGGNQFVEPQVGAVAYETGDLFVLCTDGLIDGLFDEQFHRFLRLPDPAEEKMHPAQRLVEAALERSGRDNTTALVIEIG